MESGIHITNAYPVLAEEEPRPNLPEENTAKEFFFTAKTAENCNSLSGYRVYKSKGSLVRKFGVKKFSHLLTKFYLFHKMYDKGCISCSGNMSGEAVDTPFCGAESRRSSSAVSQGKEREKEIYGK